MTPGGGGLKAGGEEDYVEGATDEDEGRESIGEGDSIAKERVG